LLKKTLLITMSFLLLLLSLFPRNGTVFAAKSANHSLEYLIKIADPHVKVNEQKRFEIIRENELSKKLSSEELNLVRESLIEANKQLDNTDLVEEIRVERNTIVSKINTNDIGLQSEGVRGIRFYWWGVELWLTKTDARAVVKGGVAGGATFLGGLFGGIGGAVAAAIASAIISEYVNPPALRIRYYFITTGAILIYPQ
jgi:hypothetical protein